MFSDYLFRLTGELDNWFLALLVQTCIRLFVLVVIAGLALSGLEMVGTLATVFMVLVVLPFVALTLIGLPDVSLSAVLATPPGTTLWPPWQFRLGKVEWTLFLRCIPLYHFVDCYL